MSIDGVHDTLSPRFGGQWAFLSSPPPPPSLQHGPRSLPPSSSYPRSDRGSSVSPLPTGLHLQHLNASRSSLPRNIYTPSVGGYSSTTIPSQPVLIRINSDVAHNHLRPAPRQPTRRPIMSKDNRLPPIEEYSFEAILNTIRSDVEEDLEGIAQILGRNRLVLAEQHESHLPPQGEITAQPLQAVAEASSSNERLAADNVLILNDEASLIDGSQTGSAAYDLLERLRAVPRARRMNSELPNVPTQTRAPVPMRMNSSPAVLAEPLAAVAGQTHEPQLSSIRRSSRNLLQSSQDAISDLEPARVTPAIVSEVWLSAGADGKVLSDPPVVSEAGRHYPLYSYDESEVFESRSSATSRLSFRERMRRLILLRDFQGVTTWISRPARSTIDDNSNAESQLRGILHRQSIDRAGPSRPEGREEDREMYD